MCTLGDAQCVSPGDAFAAAAAGSSANWGCGCCCCCSSTAAIALCLHELTAYPSLSHWRLFFSQPKDTAVWQLLTLMIAIIMLRKGEKNPNWIHNVLFFWLCELLFSVCVCLCVCARLSPEVLKNASQKAARRARVNQKHSSKTRTTRFKQRQKGSEAEREDAERGMRKGNCMWLATGDYCGVAWGACCCLLLRLVRLANG